VTYTDAHLAHFLAEEAGKRLLVARDKLRSLDADTWLAKDVGDTVAQQLTGQSTSLCGRTVNSRPVRCRFPQSTKCSALNLHPSWRHANLNDHVW